MVNRVELAVLVSKVKRGRFAVRNWTVGLFIVLGCGGSGRSVTSDGAPAAIDASTQDDADLVTCAGQGPQVCSPMPCQPAGAGMVRVCGRLVNLETSQPIAVADPLAACCDSAAPAPDGPCSLTIDTQEASMPPAPPVVRINDCGFYTLLARAPSAGYLTITVDDAGAIDDHAPTASSIPVSSGVVRSDLSLYALRRSTDEKWTQTAGDPFGGQTFSEIGVFVQIFVDDNGQPGVGVTSTANGSPVADAYYFSDTDPALRATVAPGQSATGANGTALLVNTPLVNHSGTGGDLPVGCSWSSGLAGAIAGYATVGETIVDCQ